MLFRLHTVRRKLTVLVTSTLGVVFVVIIVLSWLLHRQLMDEVDNRVDDAKSGFLSELEDDLLDQSLSLKVMAMNPALIAALEANDGKAAQAVAKVFADVYPELDFIIAGREGRVLTELGVDTPPERLDSIPELRGVAEGKDFQGVVEHGCEKPDSSAAPAIAMAKGFPGRGAIVICQPIGLGYLDNTRKKLNLELALLNPTTGKLVVATPHFPTLLIPRITHDSLIADDGKTTWALSKYEPSYLSGPRGTFSIAPALDVTGIKSIVTRNLVYALAILLITAAGSIAFGTHLAAMMSRAIRQLQSAQKRLHQQNYMHVEVDRTGDELEDLALGFNVMVDRLKEAAAMKATMGKYMARKVMDHILKEKMSIGGEKLPVTILFSDLRGFTGISERMDPQTLVGLLNEYFTEMVDAVLAEDGVVDKYIGDAIMVVFGAPEPEANDALRAVRSAVGMRRALARLNARLADRGIAPLRTGIGIHTGEVIAGSIGHEEQRQYTVIGDAVNLASRLETATKDLGVNVLISEHTYEIVKDHVVARPVKEITVKGRAQPVMTYEVIGLTGEAPLEAASSATTTAPATA